MDIQRTFEQFLQTGTSNINNLIGGDDSEPLSIASTVIITLVVIVIIIVIFYKCYDMMGYSEGFDILNSSDGIMSPTQFQMKFKDGKYDNHEGFDNHEEFDNYEEFDNHEEFDNYEGYDNVNVDVENKMAAAEHIFNNLDENTKEKLLKMHMHKHSTNDHKVAKAHALNEIHENMSHDHQELKKHMTGHKHNNNNEDFEAGVSRSDSLSDCKKRETLCAKKMLGLMMKLKKHKQELKMLQEQSLRESRSERRSSRHSRRRSSREGRSERRSSRRSRRQNNRNNHMNNEDENNNEDFAGRRDYDEDQDEDQDEDEDQYEDQDEDKDQDQDNDNHLKARALMHKQNNEENDNEEDFQGNFLTSDQMQNLSNGSFNVDNYETMDQMHHHPHHTLKKKNH